MTKLSFKEACRLFDLSGPSFSLFANRVRIEIMCQTLFTSCNKQNEVSPFKAFISGILQPSVQTTEGFIHSQGLEWALWPEGWIEENNFHASRKLSACYMHQLNTEGWYMHMACWGSVANNLSELIGKAYHTNPLCSDSNGCSPGKIETWYVVTCSIRKIMLCVSGGQLSTCPGAQRTPTVSHSLVV